MVFENNQYGIKTLLNEPMYIGGGPGLERALNDVMQYPREARRMGVVGVVRFSVVIDEEGKVSEVKILQGPKVFYDEIESGLSKIDQIWMPGSTGDKKVQCKLFYSLEFKFAKCGGSWGCTAIFLE